MKDNTVLLPIDLIKPGMITAEVVFNKFGNVLVWENIALNESMILHLQNMGIRFVPVYAAEESGDSTDSIHADPLRQFGKFGIDYERDISITKQIFQEISAGRSLSIKAANQIVDSVLVKEKENRNIIEAIMKVRSTDEYTYYHSLNVAMLCMMVGKWMRLDAVNIRNLTQAGLLHDIGKTRIPLSILNKPDKLTNFEFDEIKRHPQYGYEMITGNIEIHPETATAILTHHEKEDGSGYPLGITGDKLNLYSKIITVADIFDAMTANRSYRGKDTPLMVFALMQHGSFGVLDPVVLKVFLENITNYFVGSRVRLNTGETGEIVFMNSMDYAKPVIMIKDRYIDTAVSKNVRIEEFL